MFDLGFSELLLIALVALVVLGPERLPRAARFAGLWVRRARAQWYSVRSELERELAAEELKRNLDAARTAATDFERQARDAVEDLDAGVRKAEAGARSRLESLRGQLEGSAAPAADPRAAEAGDPAGEAMAQDPALPDPQPDSQPDPQPDPHLDPDRGRDPSMPGTQGGDDGGR